MAYGKMYGSYIKKQVCIVLFGFVLKFNFRVVSKQWTTQFASLSQDWQKKQNRKTRLRPPNAKTWPCYIYGPRDRTTRPDHHTSKGRQPRSEGFSPFCWFLFGALFLGGRPFFYLANLIGFTEIRICPKSLGTDKSHGTSCCSYFS